MEAIAIRLHGGPEDGITFTVEVDHWPPPEAIEFYGKDGPMTYVKERHSQLPAPVSGIMRGGEYRFWPRSKYLAMLAERATFDPDESTYPEHTYTPSLYGTWCATCGRDLNADRGTLGWMHTDHIVDPEDAFLRSEIDR